MKPFLAAVALLATTSVSLLAAPTDLLSSASDWKIVTPFKPAAMTFEPTTSVMQSTPPLRLKITSGGSARDVGGWVRTLPKLDKGRRYRFEVAFTVAGIDHPQRHVLGLVTNNGRELQEFLTAEKKGNRYRVSLEITPEKEMADADLRFYLADVTHGSVTLETATFEDITTTYKPRTARVAAISGKPKKPKTPEEAVSFYLEKIDQIRGLGIDLVCLPENINTDEVVTDDKWQLIETIPGPTTERLAAKAREHKVYVAASIAEREGDTRYNTAVLIDRSGQIVAKYRKTHLTVTEQLVSGITPGREFVVHPTDFGNVGLMVCYDHHYPEVARILALQGADIVVMPNAADAREKGTLWESAMRMRAVDNHVFIVSAVNFGRSLVVGPDGNIMAMNAKVDKEPGGLVHAVCEIGDSVANHTGQPIGKRYLQMRRPEIYGTLLRDLDGDLKATVTDEKSRSR
jgi:predicted amidohydrolase